MTHARTTLKVGIIGAACRLPGASDEAAFRSLLSDGRCAIRPFPEGRWDVARFLHPSPAVPGFSYSFAGGYLDSLFSFDPTVFDLSPREAQQMDPQQRLLLEVVWEALENAELPPSATTRKEIGVYVGASSLDHGNIQASDPSSIDSHFMTGNTLSVVANRISYIFDWRGPSFTVDTACSSSLVALARAFADLHSGRVDTAVVAGVNVLLSPFSFIGFSRASMLSQTGLCRPFSAAGDGYVRAEGAVAFVLTRADLARPGAIRAIVEAADVNSDGRTSGIALPGLDGQVELLQRVWGGLDVEPDAIAFVEAHGTGTRVGDPIEAEALGRVLGRRRSRPLPIGSVKSNIGHLEPASGLAGMLKALIALETRRLPATLHLDEPNPLIDFADLNLAPAVEAIALASKPETLVAGVSSFGFGGTNAHVVLRSVRRAGAPAPAPAVDRLVLSAASRDALRKGAAALAERLGQGADVGRVAAALDAGRDLLKHRAVVALKGTDAAAALSGFAETGQNPDVEEGTAPVRRAKLCYVYSGNGAQWVGMGRTAFARNAVFRRRFEEIDAAFATLDERSLTADLHAPDFAERMRHSTFMQPLLFAVQAATTAALTAAGLRPSVVLGHSIGELAAADAAGAVDLLAAARIVRARSTCLEVLHGRGTMAVFAASKAAVAELLADLGRDDVEIAADNGPSSVTISGSFEAVGLATREGRRRRMASRTLDIEYPFHSSFIEGLREPILEALGPVDPNPCAVDLISTVTGEPIGDCPLDADYWWRNVREPVHLRSAIEQATALGAELFVEIGPRPILLSPISETLRQIGANARVVASLSDTDDRRPDVDPIARVVARIVANGGDLVEPARDRPAVDRTLALPTYAWARREYHFTSTSERLNVFGEEPSHPLIGSRLAQGQHEWRALLDARLTPFLADHRVDGEIVVPATALAEMILAVGRALKADGPLAFEDLGISTPLVIPANGLRELSIRHAGATGAVEIWSRPRLGPDEWSLHARARLVSAAPPRRPVPAVGDQQGSWDASAVYAAAASFGLDYGDAFRLARHGDRLGDTIAVTLVPPAGPGTGFGQRPLLLHPASFDAALHPLLCLVEADPMVRKVHLPVRMGRLVLHRDGAEIVAAHLRLERETAQTLTVAVHLFDAAGAIVAEVEGLQLNTIVVERRGTADACFHVEMRRRERVGDFDPIARISSAFALHPEIGTGEARLMLRAHMLATTHRALTELADADGRLDVTESVADGRIAPEAAAYAAVLGERLVAVGLAERDAAVIRLARDTGLPDPQPIFATLAAEHTDVGDELLLSAGTAEDLGSFLSEGVAAGRRARLVERYLATPLLSAAAQRTVDAAFDALVRDAGGVPPRVLVAQPHSRRLLASLFREVRRSGTRVTVAVSGRERFERLTARLPAAAGIDVVDLSAAEPSRPQFDVGIVVASRSQYDADLLEKMTVHVVDGGAMITLVPTDDGLTDYWFGMTPDWFSASLDPLLPVGCGGTVDDARRDLADIGIEEIEAHTIGEPGEFALIGRVPPRPVTRTALGPFSIAAAKGDATLAEAVARAAVRQGGDPIEDRPGGSDGPTTRIRIVPRSMGDDRRRTLAAILDLRSDVLACAAATSPPRLWIVVRTGTGADIDPVAEAVRAFARVALNENPQCDLRLVDVDPALDDETAAADLVERLVAEDEDRETTIGIDGVFVPRVLRGWPSEATLEHAAEAAEIDLPRRGALEHFAWRAKSRRAPGRGEIEVEVIATGLNFRDVMLAIGLLDEGDLADGMAGAVYGFECAGRVVAVGADVTDRQVGDLVLGFASGAFATHVTTPATVFVPIPAGVDPVAAATIPVAFLTAWYGLVEMARVRPGEVVLIHGAAGGVGLAAMQVARDRGARIIATVSTPEKRALVHLLGAEAIYDSRTLDFADAVRHEFGGADVVLNSLSGEAMRAGVKCLKPFGRFVELGKRDYVADTELALRPFRRNLTYFGVDVDQLLAHDPSIVARGFQELAAGFEEGRYVPLLHRLFEADEIGEAFRLMQAAGHVGKILVRPPSLDGARLQRTPERVFRPGDGVQLVVGGTGGFGLATAFHLASAGATRIVVASRRGAVEPAAEPAIAALRARGVDFRVEQVDATELASVEALIARVSEDLGPPTGIWMTAMVLDDGLLPDLDEARIDRVLAPKIDGAVNLDRATRGLPIETFVLFSSAAALIGNPGQGAYAAANAFLEGLARRRRGEGLPALSVAWGAIADAGVLAREATTAARLARVTGVAGFTSAEALAHLDTLTAGAARFEDPVVCCARFQKTGAMRSLAVLGGPAFEGLFGERSESSEVETDLHTQIAGKSDEEALKILRAVVTEEVARILRLSPAEVDISRPLDEIGLDSLMALELRMNVETKFGIDLPLVAISSVKNLHDLARRLLQALRVGDTSGNEHLDANDGNLIAMHGGDEEAFAQSMPDDRSQPGDPRS